MFVLSTQCGLSNGSHVVPCADRWGFPEQSSVVSATGLIACPHIDYKVVTPQPTEGLPWPPPLHKPTKGTVRRMPAKRRRRPPSNGSSIAIRLKRVEAQLNTLTRAGVVNRAEHDEVLSSLDQRTADLEHHAKDLGIQFQRIAQIQMDLDNIKDAWTRLKLR